jgi:opacity protein-like surface antigen
MIRFAAAGTILSVLLGSFALAQDSTPKVQVFGGFSLMHLLSGGPNSSALDVALREPGNTFQTAANFKGWNAEAQYNANGWLGIVADFGGRYGSPFTASSVSKVSGLPDGTAYSFMAGPVISYRTKSKMTPFVHALFGWERTSLRASTITTPSGTLPSSATNYTDFAYAAGVGLDYRLSQHFAVRIGQVDYFHTSLNLNKFYHGAFGPDVFEGPATHQRNVRLSTGIVFQF